MPVFLVRKALITLLLMPVVPIAQAETAVEHHHSMMMESSAPLGLSMSRVGSGTACGDHQWTSMNWVMAMAQHVRRRHCG